MAKFLESLKEVISRLPEVPGVYRYFSAEEELIYVGKAKNLKKRVNSYFTNKTGVERKTARLVSLINRIEFTVVDTEYDALLLENSLIKQFQPRYNILLRDDKTYPYVIITNEEFPRIFPTRRLIKNSGTYFGPYPSGRMMHTLLDLIKQLYTIRTCSLPLNDKSIAENKFKVCLEFHIKNCKGPCEGLESAAEYQAQIDSAANLLKGNLGAAKTHFKNQMQDYAENLEFEKAQWAKDKLEILDNYQSKSVIVNPQLSDIDVIVLYSTEEAAYIHYLSVLFGTVVNTYNLEIKKKIEENTDAEILAIAIVNIREVFQSKAKELLTNIPLEVDIPGVTQSVPQIGDKKKLIDLAIKNAMFYKKEIMQEKPIKANPADRILKQLQADLQIKDYPDHIECFDNSNIQGTNAVAAMVCFKNGVASKKDYRHYNVKTVEGPDDFATMKEIVGRRYKRLLEEEQPLPKLIIVDGGKGQLSSACEALKELGLYGKIPILGIAKRLEELYYPEDPIPLYINKKSESIKLIQAMRDEAHRFGITHHRNKRSKSALALAVMEIPGFGEVTVTKILKEFKALSKINESDTENLTKIIGQKRTTQLLEWLKERSKTEK
jgi:excinuclease ABC subunit C